MSVVGCGIKKSLHEEPQKVQVQTQERSPHFILQQEPPALSGIPALGPPGPLRQNIFE